MSDLILGMIALAGYKAMNESHWARTHGEIEGCKVIPRKVEEAAWKVFNPWWSSFETRRL